MISRGRFLALVLSVAVAAEAMPDDSALRGELAAANALLHAGKHPEARAAFAKILADAPDNPEANGNAALYACDDGDWEKALRCAGRAIAADPNNARHQYCWGAANGIAALKAGIFSRLGHAKKCLAAYERAAELEPANLQYHWALLNYYQQAPGIAGGDSAKAYGQAAEIGKIDAEAGRQACTQLYLGEKKYDLAFRTYDEALRAAPDDYAALYNFGRLTLTTGRRLDDGFAAFRHCLELTPPTAPDTPSHANIHWRLGNLWEKQSQPERARMEYLAALKEKPDFTPAKQALEKLGGRKTE